MYKQFAFILVAFLASDSMAMTHRIRRQAQTGTSPTQAQVQPVQPNVSTTDNNTNTLSEADIQQCIQGCPVTPEFNPVCGSNRVTYSNPGRLICAQACGVNVNLLRTSPCPTN
ncbi:uncharacterized protein [Battus philenor]|uniref:uncharacterized protein n=1 Tax=Battus philenor TaxID=42288 RepID=UPI0035D08741